MTGVSLSGEIGSSQLSCTFAAGLPDDVHVELLSEPPPTPPLTPASMCDSDPETLGISSRSIGTSSPASTNVGMARPTSARTTTARYIQRERPITLPCLGRGKLEDPTFKGQYVTPRPAHACVSSRTGS